MAVARVDFHLGEEALIRLYDHRDRATGQGRGSKAHGGQHEAHTHTTHNAIEVAENFSVGAWILEVRILGQ